MKSRSTDNHHETNQRNNPPRIRPFPGVEQVNGVTYDGKQVWMAVGNNLVALDPATGKTLQTIDVAAHAGTAFDGRHIFQIGDDRIRKNRPGDGPRAGHDSSAWRRWRPGLAWAEGTLWVGEYRERKIHQIDPETGAILRTITSDRFVTGVSWVDGTLWHGAGEGDQARCVVSTRQPVKCWNRSTCHPA
jgi:outer membrane protein assembly factor BamB